MAGVFQARLQADNVKNFSIYEEYHVDFKTSKTNEYKASAKHKAMVAAICRSVAAANNDPGKVFFRVFGDKSIDKTKIVEYMFKNVDSVTQIYGDVPNAYLQLGAKTSYGYFEFSRKLEIHEIIGVFKARDVENLKKDFLGWGLLDRIALSTIYKRVLSTKSNIDLEKDEFLDRVIFTVNFIGEQVRIIIQRVRLYLSINEHGRIISFNAYCFDNDRLCPTDTGHLNQLQSLCVWKKAGQKLLQHRDNESPLPLSVWPVVLARVSAPRFWECFLSFGEEVDAARATVLYHFLREGPILSLGLQRKIHKDRFKEVNANGKSGS